MVYINNTKADGLDALTSLDTGDLVIVADASDSYRAKKITKANSFDTKINTSDIDTTVTLGTSDTKVPSQKAVKTYTDTAVAAIDKNIYKTFTAAEDLTIGRPVGVSNGYDGYVARAYRRNQTVSLGITGQSNFTAKQDTFCPIGGNKFAFLDTVSADDSLYVTISSVDQDTKTLTRGTPLAATADITYNGNEATYAICKLDTDKFIVFYVEDASTLQLKYRVGTVSGTTITYGVAANVDVASSAITYVTCDQIGTDKGVVFIGKTTVTDSRLIVFTVSGTTTAIGVEKSIGTTIDNAVEFSMVKKVATDKFILVCSSNSTSPNYCQVGTISGTTITLGTETVWSDTDSIYNYQVVVSVPEDNHVVILAYSTVGLLVAGTISGTTPTFGTTVTGVGNERGMIATSPTEILTANSSNSTLYQYSLSGTGISLVGTYILPLGLNTTRLLLLDSGYWMVVYVSGTDFYTFIKGMSNSFIGVAQATVNAGETVSVLISGVDTHQTGLSPGAFYLASDGLFSLSSSIAATTTRDTLNVVKALSTTEVLI